MSESSIVLYAMAKLTGPRIGRGRWLGRRQLVAQGLLAVAPRLPFAPRLAARAALARLTPVPTSRPFHLLRDSDGISTLRVFLARRRVVRSPRHLPILLILVARSRPRRGTVILRSQGGHALPGVRGGCRGSGGGAAASTAARAQLARDGVALSALGARLLSAVRRLCSVAPIASR